MANFWYRFCHLFLFKTTLYGLHPIIPSRAEQENCKPQSSFKTPKTNWSDDIRRQNTQLRQLLSRTSMEFSGIQNSHPLFPAESQHPMVEHGGTWWNQPVFTSFPQGTAPAALTMCSSAPRRSATAFSPTMLELLGQDSAAGSGVSWVKASSSDGKTMEKPCKDFGKWQDLATRCWQICI